MAALAETSGDCVQRRITDNASFASWKASAARKELNAFVARLNASCVHTPNVPIDEAPPSVRKLMELLRAIAGACNRFQPVAGEARRYGSPKFREWHAWLVQALPELLQPLTDNKELAARLAASFGDPGRVDYGTGHECAFVVFLLAASKVNVVSHDDIDSGSVVCGVFAEYLRTCRAVQTCFGLEPAGSRGVWALDDYQFLPFLLGCSQMSHPTEHNRAESAFGDEDTGLICVDAASLVSQSMFYECLVFVKASTGTTPLDVAAPLLFNLSRQPWHVNARRLLRLFDEEVLGQQPVVQHMLFGELFAGDWEASVDTAESDRAARMRAVMDAANQRLAAF